MLYIPASRTAACVSLLALAPFVVPAACLWFVTDEWQWLFAGMLVTWAALVLAFLGGIHWGRALEGDDSPADLWRYVYGIMPGLLAWVALMCQPANGLFLLFLGYMTTFFVDRRVHVGGYVIMRLVTSVAIILSLYAGYKAVNP